MQYTEISSLAEKLRANVGKVIVGKENQIELILTCLLAGGHILLEDVPGTGKTTMAKSLSKSLSCGFARVQFTPDLLPADITGIRVYNQHSGDFTFIKGPAFTNILLADEINRATPRTQSALLECMEERQISEGGVTYKLEEPFLVIATQNPVETQGTFPLPEAQLDRFLMRLSLGYPSQEESVTMMERFIRNQPLAAVEAVVSAEEVREAAILCRDCRISTDVMRYIAALVEAARNPDKVRLGPSPRALLALMRCCQALAAIRGRDYVIPADVQFIFADTVAHRLLLTRQAEQDQKNTRDICSAILHKVPAPKLK